MMTLASWRFDYTFADYSGYLRLHPRDPRAMCEVLESCILSEDRNRGRTFLRLIDEFLRGGGDPNLTFPKFDVEENAFRHVTLFQVVYLYWKSPRENWNDAINADFEQLIDRMLSDERTDVRSKFTEHSLLESEHFFNEKQEANYRQREEGYLLEGANIAHYAMAIEDFEMVDKVLRKAPDLLDSTCALMKGKNLLHQEVISVASFLCDNVPDRTQQWCDFSISKAVKRILLLDNNEEVSGDLAHAAVDIKGGVMFFVTRSTKVSLMHLAARLGNEVACGFFRGQRANFVARDSAGLTPFDYLKLSLSERFLTDNTSTKRLLKVLEPIARLNKPLLPEGLILLKREGYWLLYDARTKLARYAYQRLTKASLEKNAGRAEAGAFKVDRDVPQLNRGKSADYAKSGQDIGHMAPAADNASSDQAMADTFLFSNASPQNPGLNRGYWKAFEGYIRKLTALNDLVEVFTGGLFLASNNTVTYRTIGAGQTPVPTHFFKVLYLHKGLTKRAEAYILPNAPVIAGTPYSAFLSTVDKVQELAGIMFDTWRSWV